MQFLVDNDRITFAVQRIGVARPAAPSLDEQSSSRRRHETVDESRGQETRRNRRPARSAKLAASRRRIRGKNGFHEK